MWAKLQARSALWVLGGLALIYLINQSLYAGFHDSLSYVLEAEDGFSLDTNATNHFLYNNLGWALHSLLPFVDTVRLLTLLSIGFAVLSLWRIQQICRVLLPKAAPIVYSLPALLLGLSFTWWQQSEIIEVYSFSSFLLLSLILEIFRDQREGHHRPWRVGIWMGLALITHIQHILALPLFAYYLVASKKERNFAQIGKGILPVLSGVGILLIPVLQGRQELSWIFFDTQFGDEALGWDFGAMLRGSLMGLGYFVYNFHIFSFFIFHGIWLSWKRQRPFFWLQVIWLLPYLGFAVKYSVQDNHVFYLSAYLALVSFSAASFEWVWEARQRWRNPLIAALWVLPIAGYWGAWQIAERVERPFFQEYAQAKSYKGGLSHLLWPGKMGTGAKDPLEIARPWCGLEPGEEPDVEWNWPAALNLLKKRGLCEEDNVSKSEKNP